MAVFRRAAFASMTMGTHPVPSQVAAIHGPSARRNAPGSSLANTRAKVSALGMPLSSGRKSLFGVAVLGDGVPSLGRAGGEGQDIGEAVECVLGLPSQVRQRIDHSRDRQGYRDTHSDSTWCSPLYAVSSS